MTTDSPSEKISVSLVIFLDVLGFKSRVQRMQTDEDFKKIYDNLYYVQDQFAKKPDKLQKKYEQSIGKTVQVFSDCVVISLSLESETASNSGTFDPFLAELHYFGLCQMSCVCNNIFLRGGIAIGDWFYEDNILISSALLEAYDLEREMSVYPVITMAKEAFSFFKKHPHRNFYAEEIDPIKSLFRRYKTAGGKFFYFLDYLGIGYNGSADWYTYDDLKRYKSERDDDKKHAILRKSYMKNQRCYLLGHKTAVLRALKANDDDVVLSKYLWLAKYHNNLVSEIDPYFSDTRIKPKEIASCLNNT